MQKLRLIVGCFLALLITVPPLANAASVNTVNFQVPATKPNGRPLANGKYDMTFRFYDVATGGTAFATSNVPNVPVNRGIASATFPVDPAWFNDTATYQRETRYLGISVRDGNEISPRVLLTAVPYAMAFTGNQLNLLGAEAAIRGNEGTWLFGYKGPSEAEEISIGSASGVISDRTIKLCAGGFPRVWVMNNGNVGIGTQSPGAKLEVDGTVRMTVCQITSDRAAKEGFTVVNSREVLTKLASLPISTWVYTNAPNIRHIGPVAQDFYAAFSLGEDDKHIATVDADGVALAAIQALNQTLQEQAKEKDATISELRKEMAETQTRQARMELRLTALELALTTGKPEGGAVTEGEKRGVSIPILLGDQ